MSAEEKRESMYTGPKKEVASSPVNYPAPAVPRAGLATDTECSLRPDRVVTVLAVSPHDEDHIFLAHLFSHSNWKIHRADSCSQAIAVLRGNTIPVVICESEMPDNTWKGVLEELGHLPEAPLLIVTSRLADEHLWAEVLNLGGYDVLMKPFDRLEVLRVISLAWLHWKERRERAADAEMLAQVAAG
jgi:response regulator RpfG family c-di-GMP phosphodiesterase